MPPECGCFILHRYFFFLVKIHALQITELWCYYFEHQRKEWKKKLKQTSAARHNIRESKDRRRAETETQDRERERKQD